MVVINSCCLKLGPIPLLIAQFQPDQEKSKVLVPSFSRLKELNDSEESLRAEHHRKSKVEWPWERGKKNGAFNFVPRVFLHVKFKMADSLVSFLCMRYNMAFRGADQKERGH